MKDRNITDIPKRILRQTNFVCQLTFFPKNPIDNKSTYVRVLAWHLSGDKTLSVSSMT